MKMRQLGSTGLQVSELGFGAGSIGSPDLPACHVEHLLKVALDSGITLFDTAPSYGLSESRLGAFLGSMRREIVLATKVGYGVPGVVDWTFESVAAGVQKALDTMQTDYLDVVLLHSCPLETLQRGDVIQALLECKQKGHVRAIGYSGENEARDYALAGGWLDVLETSINVFDQAFLGDGMQQVHAQGIGILAKRPLGNGVWRFPNCPAGFHAEAYWHRMLAMGPPPQLTWPDLALRFVLSYPAVSSALVGTANPEHLLENVKQAEAGVLADELRESICRQFAACDQGWQGLI
ncbi:MAG: aldo/keto reductase [Acidobacteria bacterium]|nr:aldo/keto reductase [Acidobacteriota bacterium]MCB9397553.1 aldo/keto reductase [Acidobacteriota bacterium]